MAFVPYVPSVHYIPTSSNSSCRNIISSTSSTYVYSRPLSGSHLQNVTLCPEQQPLNLSDGVNPGLLLITLKLGAVWPNIQESFKNYSRTTKSRKLQLCFYSLLVFVISNSILLNLISNHTRNVHFSFRDKANGQIKKIVKKSKSN